MRGVNRTMAQLGRMPAGTGAPPEIIRQGGGRSSSGSGFSALVADPSPMMSDVLAAGGAGRMGRTGRACRVARPPSQAPDKSLDRAGRHICADISVSDIRGRNICAREVRCAPIGRRERPCELRALATNWAILGRRLCRR
jgi:hypothetical protein